MSSSDPKAAYPGPESITTYLAGETLTVTAGQTSSGIVLSGIVWNYQYLEVYGETVDTLIYSGGRETVYAGGTANHTMVNSSGQQHISSGGLAVSTLINSAGAQAVSSGGTALDVVVSSGGQQRIFAGGTANSTTISSGIQSVSGGLVNDTILYGNNGTGAQWLYSGGTAGNTVIYGGWQWVQSGGSAVSTILHSGVQQIMAGGYGSAVTLGAGGIQNVSGGIVEEVLLSSGAHQVVYSGSVNDVAQEIGGKITMYVASNVSAFIEGVHNGSDHFLLRNGSASGFYLYDDAQQFIRTGGSAVDTVLSGGRQYISAGAAATSTRIYTSGIQTVYSSGQVNDTAITGGYQVLSAGASAYNTMVNSTGSQYVYSRGIAENTTVSSGGVMYVYRGGILTGSQAIAGSMHLMGLSVDSGVEVILDLSQRRTADGAMINNLTYLAGGIERIRITGSLASGLYRLAGYASSYGSSLDIGFESADPSGVGGFSWLPGAKRYAGAAEGDKRYVITYSGSYLVLSAHQRYELLANSYTECVADDASYTDFRSGTSTGYFAHLTSGRTYADVYGGGSVNDVSGRAILAMDSGAKVSGTLYGGGSGKSVGSTKISIGSGATVVGMVVGGGHGGDVAGNVELTIQGTATGVIGGGMNGRVGGFINMDLQDAIFTDSPAILGGYANGQNTYAQVGTANNPTGGSVTVRGTTQLGALIAGGYAVNGGRSVVYGDVDVTLTGDDMDGPQIYGGGQASGGVVVNYGKTSITVDGNSPIRNIWGGGLVNLNSEAFLTEGVSIVFTGGYSNPITLIFGGGRSSGGGDTSVGYDENYEIVASSIGTNITIDSTVTVGNVYGGGFQSGRGWTGAAGGSHITINGGAAANVFGGGYSEATGTTWGDEIQGGSFITVNGGTVENMYGGGHGFNTTGKSLVEGGSHLIFNSMNTAIEIKGSVYGGGLQRSIINGGSTIEFTGLGSKLIFSNPEIAYVSGSGTSLDVGAVNGSKHLKFTGFLGNFGAGLEQFDTISFTESRVNWTVSQNYLQSVTRWDFEVFEGDTTLNWQSGSNNFNGDTLNLTFDTSGFTSGTLIEGGTSSVFTGWNQASAVNFNGLAGIWNANLSAWISSDSNWKLSLDGNDLKLSSLA